MPIDRGPLWSEGIPWPAVWLVLFAAGCLSMLVVSFFPILHRDDAIFAAVAREMLASGDWLNPRLGLQLTPRPPFTFWLMTLSMRIAGDTYLGLRLWHALLAVGLALAVYRLARLEGSREEARLGALVFATSTLVFYQNFNPQQDVPLVLFLTLGFTEYLRYRRGHPRAAILAALWVALAVLSKGVVGLAVFGLVAAADALLAWRRGRLGRWRWQEIGVGAAIFAALAVPWFVAGALRWGEPFVHTFFLGGSVGAGRLFTQQYGSRPSWITTITYVPLLGIGMLPWVGWLPGTLRRGWRALREGPMSLQLCAVWAGVYFLGVSLPPLDKEIRYLFPCLPPLAVMVGRFLSATLDDRRALKRVALISLGAGVVGLLVIGPLGGTLSAQEDRLKFTLLLPGALALFLGTAAAGAVALEGQGRRAAAVAAAGALVAFTIWTWSVGTGWERLYPWRQLAAVFRQEYRPGDRLVLAVPPAPWVERGFLVYYLRPPLQPADVVTTTTPEAFLGLWRDGYAFGLLSAERYAQMRHRFGHRVLFTMPSGWVLTVRR